MATLKELVAEHSTRTVKLAGMELPARMVGLGLQRLLEELRPSPEPPLKQDPTKGSLAKPIPDREDPMYQIGWGIWSEQHLARLLGLAIVNAGAGRQLGISEDAMEDGKLPEQPKAEADMQKWKLLLAEIEALLCGGGISITEVRLAHMAMNAPPDVEGLRKN